MDKPIWIADFKTADKLAQSLSNKSDVKQVNFYLATKSHNNGDKSAAFADEIDKTIGPNNGIIVTYVKGNAVKDNVVEIAKVIDAQEHTEETDKDTDKHVKDKLGLNITDLDTKAEEKPEEQSEETPVEEPQEETAKKRDNSAQNRGREIKKFFDDLGITTNQKQRAAIAKKFFGEALEEALTEDAIINKNDSTGRVDNRQVTKNNEPAETPAAPVETPKQEGLIPDMDFGGVNINLDASGQNNAAGFGGSTPKVESCEDCKGEECEECDEGIITTALGVAGGVALGNAISNKLGEQCDEIEEGLLDKHITSYLQEVYSNVKEYISESCKLEDNKLIVEGNIVFNSGKARKTVFEFVETCGDPGNIILEGYNKDLSTYLDMRQENLQVAVFIRWEEQNILHTVFEG